MAPSSPSSSSSPIVEACLDVLRRTYPGDNEENLAALSVLLSDPTSDDEKKNDDELLVEELYQRVDVPLRDEVDLDDTERRRYILCDHNRDGDSHRSPHTNAYRPPLPASDDADGGGGFRPSDSLRSIELYANELFGVYRKLYYGDDDRSVSSVYLWDKPEKDDGKKEEGGGSGGGFAGAFLIKKEIVEDEATEGGGRLREGSYWNAVHVVDVRPSNDGKEARYTLASTLLLSLIPNSTPSKKKKNLEGTELAGSVSRAIEETRPFDDPMVDHVSNIGKMIEESEIALRSNLDALYLRKTWEVVEGLRSEPSRAKMTMGRGVDDGGGGGGRSTATAMGGKDHATALTEAILSSRRKK